MLLYVVCVAVCMWKGYFGIPVVRRRDLTCVSRQKPFDRVVIIVTQEAQNRARSVMIKEITILIFNEPEYYHVRRRCRESIKTVSPGPCKNHQARLRPPFLHSLRFFSVLVTSVLQFFLSHLSFTVPTRCISQMLYSLSLLLQWPPPVS